MSDLTYNARKYVRFTADEFLALVLTGFCIALIVSVRELLFTHFGEFQGFQTLGLIFIFMLFILVVTVWVCKIIAIRLGHVITYRPHTWGMILGLAVTVLSAGYLPLFVPGGFLFDQPERLRVGKFLGTHKGWEVGLIAGTFPLVILLFVLLLNPIYIVTRSSMYLSIIIACCLTAIFACIPLPLLAGKNNGNAGDWFRRLQGATFGLDVAYSSKRWYIVLCCTVLFFSLVAFTLTVVGIGVGISIYAASLVLGLIGLWVYSRFFKL